ncbi:MAG: helix-turn-helix domain-containing protein [Polyangiaceae bacterium]
MTKNLETCLECGAALTRRAYVKRTRVGRYKVDDGSHQAPVCAEGHAELSFDELAEYERRAAVVVLSEVSDIGGAEIRFARKSLGLTQARLAGLLEVAPETVSRWETGELPMSRVSRLALLAVVRDPGSLSRLEEKPAKTSETLHVGAA